MGGAPVEAIPFLARADQCLQFLSFPARPPSLLGKWCLLRTEGITYYAIAKRLDAEGLTPRKAAKWSSTGVRQILNRTLTPQVTAASLWASLLAVVD